VPPGRFLRSLLQGEAEVRFSYIVPVDAEFASLDGVPCELVPVETMRINPLNPLLDLQRIEVIENNRFCCRLAVAFGEDSSHVLRNSLRQTAV
jgi:hypothetical protein